MDILTNFASTVIGRAKFRASRELMQYASGRTVLLPTGTSWMSFHPAGEVGVRVRLPGMLPESQTPDQTRSGPDHRVQKCEPSQLQVMYRFARAVAHFVMEVPALPTPSQSSLVALHLEPILV